MIRRAALSTAVSLAFVALAPRVARADLRSFEGRVPPALAPFEQVQGDRILDLSRLRGKTVVLEFFATW